MDAYRSMVRLPPACNLAWAAFSRAQHAHSALSATSRWGGRHPRRFKMGRRGRSPKPSRWTRCPRPVERAHDS